MRGSLFARTLRMPRVNFALSQTPKGIRYEKVGHPSPFAASGLEGRRAAKKLSAYRVYHRQVVIGVVCQVRDRTDRKQPLPGLTDGRFRFVTRWLPIANGRNYHTASELLRDTRADAAKRLLEIKGFEESV